MAIHSEGYNLDLNSLSYTLNIFIGDLDNEKVGSYLYNDNLASFMLEADINHPTLGGRMVYTDRNNLFLNSVDPNNSTFMKVNLMPNTLSTQPFDPIRGNGDELEHLFLIDRIEIIDRGITDVTYSIEFTSSDWSNFNNYLPYSSEGPKNHLDILKDLFNRGGLQLDISEGAQTIDKESTFITAANYTLNDSIKYILSISASEETFVYNFILDSIKNKYRLFSPKKDLDIIIKGGPEAKKLVPDDNVLLINSRYDAPTGKAAKRAIYDISSENINGTTHNIERTKDLLFYHYDQTTRKWSETEVNNKKIINSLPNESSKERERFINTFKTSSPVPNNKFIREIVPREPFIYDSSIREIFNDSKILKFKTEGWLNRRAGQFLYISINAKDEMYDKLDGLWFIIKIIKTISGADFEDVIYACRIDRGKPLFENLFGNKADKYSAQ